MKLIALVLLLSSASLVRASPLILRTAHQRIVIPQRDSQVTHDFQSEFCRGGIDHSILHAAVRRGDTLYVVFTCEGYSRGAAYSGPGGAGWEKQINWVAIQGDVVVDSQREDIESWWQQVAGGISGWHRGVLVWSAEHGGSYDPAETTGFFDPRTPEKGLQKPANSSNAAQCQ